MLLFLHRYRVIVCDVNAPKGNFAHLHFALLCYFIGSRLQLSRYQFIWKHFVFKPNSLEIDAKKIQYCFGWNEYQFDIYLLSKFGFYIFFCDTRSHFDFDIGVIYGNQFIWNLCYEKFLIGHSLFKYINQKNKFRAGWLVGFFSFYFFLLILFISPKKTTHLR